VNTLQFGGKNGDVAGKRKPVYTGTQYKIADFFCRSYRAQTTLNYEKGDFPEADGAYSKLRFSQSLAGNPLTVPSERVAT